MDKIEWYEDRGELLAFVRANDEAGLLEDVSAALYMIEKPWKWNDEHAAWVAAGRPSTMPEAG